MAVIPPQFTKSESVEVVLAPADGSVVVVDQSEAQDQVRGRRRRAHVVCHSGAPVRAASAHGPLHAHGGVAEWRVRGVLQH